MLISWLTSPQFENISGMVASAGFLHGMRISVSKGFNAEREEFIFDAYSTAIADEVLTVTASTMGRGHFISQRRVYRSVLEMEGDSRVFDAGTLLRFRNHVYDVLASGEVIPGVITASGQTLRPWCVPNGYAVEVVLSRLRSGLSTHLCGLSLESQGALAAER